MDVVEVLSDALRTAFGPLGAAYALAAIGLNLQFGNFGQRRLNRVLDGADLGGNFERGGFDHLFAHDVLLHSARAASYRGAISNVLNERAASR